MSNPINNIQDAIIEEFELFDDWNDKYAYIIELGKKLAPLDEQYKIPAHIIKGCQSNVWLHCDLSGEKLVFTTDSDAIIVKGLIFLLVRALSNQSPEHIIGAELYFIDKIGMRQHLSQTRSNGLSAMVKQMKLYAVAFKAKLEAK